MDASPSAQLANMMDPVFAWAIDVPSLVIVSGGLVALAIAAWLQARQWRLRHSLLVV